MPPKKKSAKKAAKKAGKPKTIGSLTHEEATRKNIPSAEMQPVISDELKAPIPVTYARGKDEFVEEEQHRNRDLDPQLIWQGKTRDPLVVPAPPLFIQEKVHPKVLIDDLHRQSKVRAKQDAIESGEDMPDLFADFNSLPKEAKSTDFYQHEGHWQNRMILGDSLQVMASLSEREGLRGKVQCIYFDPPYGIKFNSNFQWSTTSRDVKDGKADHISREPEQVKAFRDTWRKGIHSYLDYLRDRLIVARDLLTESGSIFVQIGDENVHRVRALMDEVFGEGCSVVEILVKKKGSQKSSLIDPVNDYILWYSKSPRSSGGVKSRKIYERRRIDADTINEFSRIELQDGEELNLKDYSDGDGEKLDFRQYPTRVTTEFPGGKLFRAWPITNGGSRKRQDSPINLQGESISPPKGRCWSHTSLYEDETAGLTGMDRVKAADRLVKSRSALDFKRYLDDFPYKTISNWWDGLGGASDQVYIVQTNARLVERCIMLCTDPGDLVLDPTCGSGTTAHVSEQWGRRWITIDTSRVALALARARIMGGRHPFYLLADSREGKIKEAGVTRKAPVDSPSTGNIAHGFVYERCNYITSGLIANNAEIDVIWEQAQLEIAPLLEQLTAVVGEKWIVASREASHQSQTTSHHLAEWEMPREMPHEWPAAAKTLHENFWTARVARQREIDASIAAKADSEFLYDKPYEDKSKVRVAGPFTVESISPHRTLTVDENDEVVDGWKQMACEPDMKYNAQQDFATVIMENLKTAGVQQRAKADRIVFTAVVPFPGTAYICGEGHYTEGESENAPTKRAGIFIGPEFGTVSRPDLVAAAREAADLGFDVLIACAFNYDAHSAEFEKLGRIPVLKARMNADLHMAGELKNTGKGNLFVIFGEPDIVVAGEEWLVDGQGRRIAPYELYKIVSGTGSLAEINGLSGQDLSCYADLSQRREVWDYLADAASQHLDSGKYRRGTGKKHHGGVSAIARDCARLPGGVRDFCDALREAGIPNSKGFRELVEGLRNSGQNAHRAHQSLAKEKLSTSHYSQVTILGVDVFKPQTGKVESSGPEGIACWFIDTNYNEESFFVRHAYFLGQSDPYKSLRTTLKAEIDQEAWSSLNSDLSRPFPKPETGRIAVKVINHLGDEVMKVFSV